MRGIAGIGHHGLTWSACSDLDLGLEPISKRDHGNLPQVHGLGSTTRNHRDIVDAYHAKDHPQGRFTLDQLRVLVAIADCGSFSAAGRHLRRAQSAVSQAIASLETAHDVALFDRAGRQPQLTKAGRALLIEARAVLRSAARFEALASSVRDGVESMLALAIDPLVPTAPFMKSLKALSSHFPDKLLSFSTEELGGAERRLGRGEAALALCLLLPTIPDDIVSFPLLSVELIPVVAKEHPLAILNREVRTAELEEHIQLVLSDPIDPEGPNYGVLGTRTWRFVDLARRMDFALAGLGWCRLPDFLVRQYIAEGRLVRLSIVDDPATQGPLTIYAAHMRNQALGRAGRWLLEDLKVRLARPEHGLTEEPDRRLPLG